MNASGAKPSITSRTIALIAAAGVIALVGAAFRITCAGQSCNEPESALAQVPFCGLPDRVRLEIGNGFREGRSPNVLAVSGGAVVAGADGLEDPLGWPSASAPAPSLPLIFAGVGVTTRAELPNDVTVDRIAPTLAEVIGLDRPFPEVRSGRAIEAVASGDRPALAIEVVIKGHDSESLGSSRVIQDLASAGSATMAARAGTAPLDPAALITTIGTGGMPRQHGITGTLLRNEQGRVVEAWGPRDPQLVIATLADDLDELNDQRPRIGLVGTALSDRGLIDGTWYIHHDRDDIRIDPGSSAGEVAGAAARLLREGYGRDETPDLLGITLDGTVAEIEDALGKIERAAETASNGSYVLVLTATGSALEGSDLSAQDVASSIESEVGAPVVDAVALGGIFIDQAVLAETGLSDDRILRAVESVTEANGARVFDDVFTAIAVTFERYC